MFTECMYSIIIGVLYPYNKSQWYAVTDILKYNNRTNLITSNRIKFTRRHLVK